MNPFLIGFALGVTWLQFQPQLPSLLLLAVGLLGWVFLGLALRLAQSLLRGGAVVVFLFLGCFAGMLWADWNATRLMEQTLPPEWEGQSLLVEGIITDLPTPLHQGVRFAFSVQAVEPARAAVPHHLSLAWFQQSSFSAGAAPPNSLAATVHPGQRWRFGVKLKHPHGLANPGGFDFEAWMLSQGFRATGVVEESIPPQQLGTVGGVAIEIHRLRDRIRAEIYRALPHNPWSGVMVALVVGDQSQIDADSWNLFWQTGVGHLMSISGLHITMLAGLVAGLARRLHPSVRWVSGVRLLAALAYSLLAGFSIPTQRTLYMIAVASLTPWLYVQPGFARMLLLALALALWADPWAVLEPGFWLSFGAVAALVFSDLNQQPGGSLLMQAWRSQWVATWAMLPLLVLLFQQVSLVAPAANALAIPLVSLGVVPLALAATLPGLGGLLSLACGLFQAVMLYLHWVASWPLSVWSPPQPGAAVFALSLAGLLFMLAPRGLPGRWLGSLALLPLLFSPAPAPPPGDLWVDVLDVGQGLAVVVRTHGHVLVYDTGPRYSDWNDGGTRVLLPALRAMGVHGLDALVISHRDTDHSGGADSLVAMLPPGFLLSSLEPQHELQGKVAQSIPCYRGQAWQWDGVDFEILHPQWADYYQAERKTNNRSCVLRISARSHSVLLPADIEASSERELLERNEDLAAEVLIAPHHGSKTSSTPEFIRAVSPRWVIYTVGYGNRFGHPKAEIESRYQQAGVRALRTDRTGAIQIKIENNQWLLESWRESHQHYWSKEELNQPMAK